MRKFQQKVVNSAQCIIHQYFTVEILSQYITGNFRFSEPQEKSREMGKVLNSSMRLTINMEALLSLKNSLISS